MCTQGITFCPVIEGIPVVVYTLACKQKIWSAPYVLARDEDLYEQVLQLEPAVLLQHGCQLSGLCHAAPMERVVTDGGQRESLEIYQ